MSHELLRGPGALIFQIVYMPRPWLNTRAPVGKHKVNETEWGFSNRSNSDYAKIMSNSGRHGTDVHTHGLLEQDAQDRVLNK